MQRACAVDATSRSGNPAEECNADSALLSRLVSWIATAARMMTTRERPCASEHLRPTSMAARAANSTCKHDSISSRFVRRSGSYYFERRVEDKYGQWQPSCSVESTEYGSVSVRSAKSVDIERTGDYYSLQRVQQQSIPTNASNRYP